jgi:hypothetical protein
MPYFPSLSSSLSQLTRLAKSGVQTIACKQAIMVSAFDNPSGLHHNDSIGMNDRRKAMCNGERCTPLHQGFKRSLNRTL